MSLVTIKKGPRISLLKIFSAGLAGILLAFSLLSYFTFSRLTSFEATLVNISEQDLPNLINSSQLFNQAARLLQSTEQLSKSNSAAAKRVVQNQIADNLRAIRMSASIVKGNEYLAIQFDTISAELDEFSDLISERLELKNQMGSLQGKIAILGQQASQIDPDLSSGWLLDYLQALIKVNQALDERKLQRVRFLFSQLTKRLNVINDAADTQKSTLVKKHLIDELNTLLFAQNGLVALKIKTLRIEGKVIGRANFVHNLIEDYVAHLAYETEQTEKNMTAQVAASVDSMQQQTELIRILLVISLILLLLVVLVFQRQMLKRLGQLNHIIRSEAQGKHAHEILHGNDEITDLAESFVDFTHTIARQKHILEQISMLDGLTGLANQRAFNIRLEQDLKMALHHNQYIAVMAMDIDCFKAYNEHYKPAEGDKCLQLLSKVLSEFLANDADFVARAEQRDFICILPDTGLKRAQEIAQNIINRLRELAMPHECSQIVPYVTMSIGISIGYPEKPISAEEIIQKADRALSEAKTKGKNTFALL